MSVEPQPFSHPRRRGEAEREVRHQIYRGRRVVPLSEERITGARSVALHVVPSMRRKAMLNSQSANAGAALTFAFQGQVLAALSRVPLDQAGLYSAIFQAHHGRCG